MDLPSTDEAIAAIRESGITVRMGFMCRFDQGYQAARDCVASGSLGEVLLLVAQNHDFETPEEAYVAISGGIFADMLIHEFDSVRFVTGQEIVEVMAAGSTRSLPAFAKYDDHATVVVTAHLDPWVLSRHLGRQARSGGERRPHGGIRNVGQRGGGTRSTHPDSDSGSGPRSAEAACDHGLAPTIQFGLSSGDEGVRRCGHQESRKSLHA